MALKKINACMLVVWFAVTLFCVFESSVSSAKAQSSYQTTMVQDDPAMPSSRYVLDKLNQHITDNAVSDSEIKQKIVTLQSDVKDIKDQKIGESIAKLIERGDTDRWMLRAMLAGVVTMMGKEALILLNKNKSKS